MSVRVRKFSNTAQQEANPQEFDTTIEQRETTVDGYTFHWAINETRAFLDDSVGARHASFGARGVKEDVIPYGSSRS